MPHSIAPACVKEAVSSNGWRYSHAEAYLHAPPVIGLSNESFCISDEMLRRREVIEILESLGVGLKADGFRYDLLNFQVSPHGANMSHVFEANHPLIRHHLSILRDKSTPPAEFRALVGRLAALLAYEATQDLQTGGKKITTPLVETDGFELTQRIGIVPILRAGLGMVEPVLNFIPHAEVWHLGLYRDEATAKPVEYYQKLPETDPVDVALVLDPMLATGGSATVAIRTLKHWGVTTIKLCAIIAAAPGIEEVQRQFPDTQIYVCTIDAELNASKFIVPGLGDAGDRIFNTR